VSAIRPQRGYQEAILSTPADIAIGGGAAGAGKTYASILELARHVSVPGFGAVVFRRTFPELRGPGSIWEESLGVFLHLGGEPRETLDWRFPSGARIQMRHLEYEKDVLSYQSKQFCLIVFEELTHFTERQFWYMLSRNRSTCGVRPYIRATCNPDPDSFVARLVEWWIDQDTGFAIPERSGVLRWFVRQGDSIVWADTREELAGRGPEPMSLTFIGGSLDDNKILTRIDPGYRAKLEAMPRVDRERLLNGNWRVKPAAGMYFRRGYFEVLDDLPTGKITRRVRAWDKAATEPSEANRDPDYTVGVKIAYCDDGTYIVEHVERLRGTPARVDATIKAIAQQDGPDVTIAVYQDPGQAGVVDVDHMRRSLDGHRLEIERPSKDKITMAGPYSSACEGGRVKLMRGAWNDAFIAEHEDFPQGKHDDQVDAAALAYRASQKRSLAWSV
jgi:predicted phage terminase large subunit-like protein